jgi:phospholipid/cholesterol/gamma-HCH transport system substrate-binding protein
MSDRSLGFSVILFLIVFVFIPAMYLSSKALAPGHLRTIVFDSINTGSFLRIEDPVRMKGFEVGLVQSITWNKGKTLVKIETAQPLLIHREYSIIAEAKGLMGDRYLEINPGGPNTPMLDEKELLYGDFPIGPTETIAFMGKLKTMVDSLVKITIILKNGSSSSGTPSFIASFHSVTGSLDSIAASLSKVLKEIDRKIGKGIDSLALALQKADTLSGQLNSTVPETLSSLNSIIAKTEKLLIAADTLVATSDRLVKKANGPEATELATTFNKLKIQIETVRDLLREIRKKGIVLPIKIR